MLQLQNAHSASLMWAILSLVMVQLPLKMQGSSASSGGPFLRYHCVTIGHAPGLSTSASMLKGCLHAQVLCFEACWDNSAQEFGDMRKFRVLYFLADSTVEVRYRVPSKTTGRHCCRQPAPILLPTARKRVFTAGT